jgi:hypothetical protein
MGQRVVITSHQTDKHRKRILELKSAMLLVGQGVQAGGAWLYNS